MFKLESYITPILLSRVERYVKNVSADQSQVSLWGGDVHFSNLDLRLDVLERELKLPFTFVSGHIHELHIHVPWTRLNAEPIVVTINTIECVLKLPSETESDGASSTSGASTIAVRQRQKRRKRKPGTDEASPGVVSPPGYMQSLINKIISNVSIVCNNLILKYVEGDIVLSLNTRRLRICSANSLWQAAFTEMALPDHILRKLVEVTDLTVCLDRRNASGKIEVYQEPLLYRCSLTIHAAWCYDSAHSKVPSVSRYEIRCPKLDFSLTDTQIPMFMRVIKLALALYYGEIASRKHKSQEEHEDEQEDEIAEAQDLSWTGWAWNVGTSVGSAILPVYWEDDDSAEFEVPKLDTKRDLVFHAGFYVDHATLVIKLTRRVHDSKGSNIFGSAKQFFAPFLKVDGSGFFQEIVVKGIGKANVSIGVSHMEVIPMGKFPCDVRDTKSASSATQDESPYFQCGMLAAKNYLRGSLFEGEMGGSETPRERLREYKIEWDEHLKNSSEEIMLKRAPAMAMDYLYCLEIPDDYTSEQLSEIDLEHSNLVERALCRFVIGPSNTKVCSGLLHRCLLISEFSSLYDYPPYKYDIDETVTSAAKDEKAEPGDLEVQSTPQRMYQATAINLQVSLLFADHPTNALGGRRHGETKKRATEAAVNNIEDLPALTLRLECLDAHMSQPMYPMKLNRDSPAISCYINTSMKVVNLSGQLTCGEQAVTVLKPCNLQVNVRQLPFVCDDSKQIQSEFILELCSLSMRFTRPQYLIAEQILRSHYNCSTKTSSRDLIKSSAFEDAFTKRMSCLVFHMSGIRLQHDRTSKVRTIQLSVESLGTVLNSLVDENGPAIPLPVVDCSPVQQQTQQMFSGVGRSPSKSSPGRGVQASKAQVVSVSLQVPISVDSQEHLSLVYGHIGELHLSLDPLLLDWIAYQDCASETSGLPPRMQRDVSVFSNESVLGKTPSLSDTGGKEAHSGTRSDRGSLHLVKQKAIAKSSDPSGFISSLTAWFPTLNSLLVQFSVDHHQLFIPRRTLLKVAGKTVLETVRRAQDSREHFILGASLPSVILENVSHKPMILQFLNAIPFDIPESVWTIGRDNLPWTLALSQLSVFTLYEKKSFLLESVTTSCTLGLTARNNKKGSNSIALCVHADVSPIKFCLDENQLIFIVNMAEGFMTLLARAFPNLTRPNQNQRSLPDVSLTEAGGGSGSTAAGPSLARPNLDIFSETSLQLSDVLDSVMPDTEKSLSLWMQWTLPQICVQAIAQESNMMVLNMEDCQSSFDWTPVYFKMKSRISTANVYSKIRNNPRFAWELSPASRGHVFSCGEDLSHQFHFINSKTKNIEILPHSRHFESDSSFFNLTVTRAERKSIQNKWREMMRKAKSKLPWEDEDVARFVTEIDLKLSSVDVVICPKELLPYANMVGHVCAVKVPFSPKQVVTKASGDNSTMTGLSINNNSVPLVYVKAKTIRVFLLATSTISTTTTPDGFSSMSASSAAVAPDFLLLQADSVSVSPQVENPLARALIRPDLYHLATPFLSVPGAHIEDRQYEVNLNGMGVYTGKWEAVLTKSEKPIKPQLKAMGENPALEWNTTKEHSDQQLATEVLLLPCLSRFDLNITLAPAIVLDQCKNERITRTLVAGHALELNAVNDISAFFSLSQVRFCSELASQVLDDVAVVYKKLRLRSSTSLDSGIDCEASSINADQQSSVGTVRIVPLELLITGSNLSIAFFRLEESEGKVQDGDRSMWRKVRCRHRRSVLERSKQLPGEGEEESDLEAAEVKKRRTTSDDNIGGSFDRGYDASEEGSAVVDEVPSQAVKLFPLLHANIMQPHLFVTCSSETQKGTASFFDASVSLAPTDFFLTCGAKRLPDAVNFPVRWFQTKQGDVDPKSGVPPSLFTCTVTNFIKPPMSVSLALERPLQFDLSNDVHKLLLRSFGVINEAFSEVSKRVSEESHKNMSNSSREHKDSVADWFCRVKERPPTALLRLNLHFKQVVCRYYQTLDHLGKVEVVSGISGFALKASAKTKKDLKSSPLLDSATIEASISKLLVRLFVGGVAQTVMGPLSADMRTLITCLPHSNFPTTYVNVKTGEVRFQVGPSVLLAAKLLGLGASPDDASSDGKTEKQRVLKITEQQNSTPAVEQYYKDDLRAGAFQYKTDTSSTDPKPYQVVFSDSSPSAMTWCYPQPRVLTRVSVFPVPFVSAAALPGKDDQDSEGIRCSLQFWDSCLADFRTYSEFYLSELRVSHLNLPTVGDRKRSAVSAVWRVVIHIDDREDDFARLPETEAVISPRALVSVLRIDSIYSSKLIPSLQASVTVPSVVVDFFNQFHFCGNRLDGALKNFTLKSAFPMSQHIGRIKADAISLGADAWVSPEYKVGVLARAKLLLQVELVDYAFLAIHSLLEPTKLQAQVSGGGDGTYEIQLHTDSLRIRVGQFTTHTLSVSSRLWEATINNSTTALDNVDEIFHPVSCMLVCNDTPDIVRFGQADTDESILLKPRECCMYAWRTNKASLKLRLCVEDGYWKWCESFSVDADTPAVVRRGVVVTTTKLSATQKMICFRGLLSAASLLRENLELRVLIKVCDDVSDSHKEGLVEQRSLLGSFSSSPSFIVPPERGAIQGLKVRLLGIGTPWSGEIPLQQLAKKKHLLVRIPTKEKGRCLTVWCRAVSEPNIKRTLILFSPMYMARSLLPSPMKVLVTPTGGQPLFGTREVELPGRDIPVQLDTGGPSDQKYNVSFKVADDLPTSEPIQMSWGLIERVREEQPVEMSCQIDQIVSDLPKLGLLSLETRWPFVDLSPLPPLTSWQLNDQSKTDVQVNFTQFHPLCNTLCMEINPWCLIVNQLGLPLLLKDHDDSFCLDLAENSVLVPPRLVSPFHLGLRDAERTFFSAPLALSDQEWHFRIVAGATLSSTDHVLPMEGEVRTKILLDGQLCFLTLQTRCEYGVRVIHIRPTFVLTNKSDESLLCAPITLFRVAKVRTDSSRLEFASTEINKNETLPLLLWQTVGDIGSAGSVFEGLRHLFFSVEDSRWGAPLKLDCGKTDRKIHLSVPRKSKSNIENELLAVTAHERRGQDFLIVYSEDSPEMEIHNKLAVPIHYAQETKQEGISASDPFFSNVFPQTVRPGKSALFSYPWYADNFPTQDSGKGEDPFLVLASSKVSVDSDKVGAQDWSNGIDTSRHHEEIVVIPKCGDIKVCVEPVGRTTHIYLQEVSKVEISAKDIRSRIAEAAVKGANNEHRQSDDVDVDISSEDSSFVALQTELAALAQSDTREGPAPVSPVGTRVKPAEFVATVFIEELSFCLSDDCVEQENLRDEFVLLTLESVSLTFRPSVDFGSNPLLSCGHNLPRTTELVLSVHNLQLDNQLFRRFPHDFPVVVCSREATSSSMVRVPASCITDQVLEQLHRDGVMTLRMRFDANANSNMLKAVTVKMAPLAVYVEDKFVHKMVQVMASFRPAQQKTLPAVWESLPEDVLLTSQALLSQLYLDDLSVEPLSVSVSVHASIKMHIGLDQSPLDFAPFQRRRLRTTHYALGQQLARHFISGALFRAGWVVGSLDLIGSPAGFTRTLGSGIRDFVFLPYEGAAQGPWAFLGGITHGSSSLVKHVSAGALTSVTNFASSVSRNLDRLSLDEEHQLRNEVVRRERPQGLGQGLFNGLSGVGISLLGAIGGLAHHPIRALLNQGLSPTGLAAGVTRGIVGAVTKPLGGAAELVAQTGQGLLEGSGWSNSRNPKKSALPEHVVDFTPGSGGLKHAWKLLRCADAARLSHQEEILSVAEAIHDTSPVTLVLTEDFLFVVNPEEDVVDSAYCLTDVDLRENSDDPTMLTLSVGDGVGVEAGVTAVDGVDRVALFVLGIQCPRSDMEEEKNNEEKRRQEIVFYLSPVVKSSLLAVAQIATRQIRHKGFKLL